MSDAKPDWNLTKDIFFVELLEHECRSLGKPIGGLTKEAWKTVVREFTAKYGPFYQRDKLINRKRTLMEHYKTLKFLMESSSGFAWDGNKLTASESTWEDMIARTPGVRSYMDKSFPPYDSLCTIFQERVLDERASLTGTEVVEVIGSSSSSRLPTSTRQPRRQPRRLSTTPSSLAPPRASSRPSKLQCRSKSAAEAKAEWTLKKDIFLVDLMAKECRILRKPVGGLTKDAWQTIVREFTAKYGSFYQRDKLINRKKTLLEHYKTLKYLMESSSDFGWDGNKLSASEGTWEEVIARVPTVRSYRDRSFPPYESLCTIFQEGDGDGPPNLTGVEVVEAIGSSDRPNDGCREELPERGIEYSDSTDERLPQPPPLKRSRSDTSGSSSRGTKKRDREADRDAITRIATAVEKFTETFAEASRHAPFRDVLTALEETPELTETEYSRAVTVLASDPKLGDAFVLLPTHRRVAWLRSIFC